MSRAPPVRSSLYARLRVPMLVLAPDALGLVAAPDFST